MRSLAFALCLAASPALAAAPLCNNVADDTAALQAGLTAGRLVLPPGKCLFSQPLTAAAVTGGAILGDGGASSQLIYTGGSTTSDLVTIPQGANWHLEGFRITSRTMMTGGSAIHGKGLARAVLSDVVIDGQDGYPYHLWDGIWFDQADFVTWRGGQVFAQNEGIKVNGGAMGSADLMISQVKVSRAAVGIHIGGGFGGFTCDQTDIIGNGENVVIDNALAPVANREIFLGPNCWSDKTSAGDGIYIDDTLADGGTIAIQGWVASAAMNGVHVVKWTRGLVSVSGPTVFNNTLAGIKVDDPTAVVKVSPATYVHANGVAP